MGLMLLYLTSQAGILSLQCVALQATWTQLDWASSPAQEGHIYPHKPANVQMLMHV